jgi:hypothetical protein
MSCCGQNKDGQENIAATIMRGAVGITKSVLGVDASTPEEIAAREAACVPCPHRKHNNSPDRVTGLNRCKLCRCFIKAAVRVKSKDCPDGRWKKISL